MAEKNNLAELLALDQKTGFSKAGQGSQANRDAVAEPAKADATQAKVAAKKTAVSKIKKPSAKSAVTIEDDNEQYPWMNVSDVNTDFLFKMPLDMKLLLKRLSRLSEDDNASMTSIMLDSLKKELRKMAKDHGLPLPKSLKD